MRLFAAIDILDGRCVRLLRGDFAAATVYSGDPVTTAGELVAAGAPALHVVDLDGARAGFPVHAALVAEIARAAPVDLQAGGGVRSFDDAHALLAAGASRVLLGTAALRDPAWTAEAVRRFGAERLVVAVDVRGERIFVSGWTAGLEVTLEGLLASLEQAGVTTLLVTDISRDGTLEGPNLELYRRLSVWPFRFLAAGGIAGAADLQALAALGVDGAVVGRAIYEGTLTLQEVAEFSQAAPRARETDHRLP